MQPSYKHDFKMTPIYEKFMEEQIHKIKNHILDPDGIPISKEFHKRELGPKTYNKIWRKKPKYYDKHPYMPVIMYLCQTYYPTAKNILEVGAGFGHFAVKFVSTFNPDSYTAYEFSSAAKLLKKRLGELPCKTTVYKGDFHDMEDYDDYDCVIALEILEHINWDLGFLLRLKRDTWAFFSLPTKHAKNHVRAFLTHKSIWKRYRDILDIREIKSLCLYENFPKWWCIAARKR